MEVDIYSADGAATKRKAKLDPSVFEIEPNDHVVWLDVRRIQAGSRQGTHKAKERNEVRGSTRKLYRQKGTGFARAGSAKSPIRRSGGTLFGPKPRNYAFKVNKKTTRLARRSALTYKAREDACRVVEPLDSSGAGTNALVAFIAALDVGKKKILLLTNGYRQDVYRSSRNLPRVTVKEAGRVSTLDILQADVVVFEENAIESLHEVLSEREPAAGKSRSAGAAPQEVESKDDGTKEDESKDAGDKS